MDAPNPGSGGKLQVLDVYDIKGVGIVAVGEVTSGSISPSQATVVNGKTAKINAIEARHQQIAAANSGDKVGVSLSGVSKGDLNQGMVLEFR